MRVGMAAMGTETSCLIEAPSFDCTSLICSRAAHIRARSAPDWAIEASETMPRADGGFERGFQHRRLAAAEAVDLDQRVPGREAGGGIARQHGVRNCRSSPKRGISSKAVRREPARWRMR